MKWRKRIAALVAAGASIAVAVSAWPAAAKPRRPLVINTAPPLHLPVVRTVLGDDEPHDLNLSQLVPRRTHILQVWFVRGKPKQVLVEWIQNKPVPEYGPYSARWGLQLWTVESRDTRWQAVDIPVLRKIPAGAPSTGVALADVTGDGHADVLVQQQWNQGCGPHEVVATFGGGQVWRIFSSGPLCNATFAGSHGLLRLDVPYFTDHEPVCCPNMHEHLLLRWNGSRYVTASLRIH